jgi:hypothetical protein
MPRSVKPVNRVDKALRIARDALDVAMSAASGNRPTVS